MIICYNNNNNWDDEGGWGHQGDRGRDRRSRKRKRRRGNSCTWDEWTVQPKVVQEVLADLKRRLPAGNSINFNGKADPAHTDH